MSELLTYMIRDMWKIVEDYINGKRFLCGKYFDTYTVDKHELYLSHVEEVDSWNDSFYFFHRRGILEIDMYSDNTYSINYDYKNVNTVEYLGRRNNNFYILIRGDAVNDMALYTYTDRKYIVFLDQKYFSKYSANIYNSKRYKIKPSKYDRIDVRIFDDEAMAIIFSGWPENGILNVIKNRRRIRTKYIPKVFRDCYCDKYLMTVTYNSHPNYNVNCLIYDYKENKYIFTEIDSGSTCLYVDKYLHIEAYKASYFVDLDKEFKKTRVMSNNRFNHVAKVYDYDEYKYDDQGYSKLFKYNDEIYAMNDNVLSVYRDGRFVVIDNCNECLLRIVDVEKRLV